VYVCRSDTEEESAEELLAELRQAASAGKQPRTSAEEVLTCASQACECAETAQGGSTEEDEQLMSMARHLGVHISDSGVLEGRLVVKCATASCLQTDTSDTFHKRFYTT
jgi:hypothetical protein